MEDYPMKMRALVVSGKGKLKAIGEMLAKNGTYAADVIPPAYSCDRERLVVIIASLKSSMPDSFRRFCQELSKDKAQNVALIVDGKEADAKMVSGWIAEAGANVIDNVLYFPVSFFAFFSKNLTPDEITKVNEWYDAVIAALN